MLKSLTFLVTLSISLSAFAELRASEKFLICDNAVTVTMRTEDMMAAILQKRQQGVDLSAISGQVASIQELNEQLAVFCADQNKRTSAEDRARLTLVRSQVKEVMAILASIK